MFEVSHSQRGNLVTTYFPALVTICTDRRPRSAASSRHAAPPGPARPSPAHQTPHRPTTNKHQTPSKTNFLRLSLLWCIKTANEACFTMVTNIIIWIWLSPFLDNNNQSFWLSRSCYKIGSCNLVILLQDRTLQFCDLGILNCQL